MSTRSLKKLRNLRFWSRQQGIMSVEMVFLFPLIALIAVAITEIGFLWFVRHNLTNASREGARAAVVFVVDNRQNFAQTEAKNAVDAYLNGIKFNFLNTWKVDTEVPAGQSWTTGVPVTVMVETPSGLLLLDKFIPAFKDLKVLGVATMRLE
jgi:Flp pilus assembly protein TadG